MLGNSAVTKSQNVALKPSSRVPANADKGTECLQQESSFLFSQFSLREWSARFLCRAPAGS